MKFKPSSGSLQSLLVSVSVGVVYGVLLYTILLNNSGGASGLTALFGVPIAVALISLFVSNEEIGNSIWRILVRPMVTYLALLLALIIFRIEDFACVLFLIGPAFLLFIVIAFIFSVKDIRQRQNGKKLMVTFAMPFLLFVAESYIVPNEVMYDATDSVTIDASPSEVWSNIIRVAPISDEEFEPGFFQYIGVPRPIEAKLLGDSIGGKRTGYFDEGLLFNETILDWQPNKRVSFSVEVDPTSLRDRVVDEHVLNGGYFRFATATYTIDSLAPDRSKLTLSARYALRTKVNWYSEFWGDLIISDFQQRLLAVVKHRMTD